MNTQPNHPLNVDLLRLVELVEALPEPELTEAEKDRAKTRELLAQARRRNARRPFKPGQTR